MKTICWDCDDVLNHLMEEWLTDYKISTGIIIDYSNIIENPPYNILDISKKDYLNSLDKFRQTKFDALMPNICIYDWFKKNGYKYNHIVLTSTPLHCAYISVEWIIYHFGEWIRSFNFIPSYRKGDKENNYFKTKQEFILNNYVDIFIDDNPKNHEGLEELDIKCFMPKQPWNEGQEIVNILDELEMYI